MISQDMSQHGIEMLSAYA